VAQHENSNGCRGYPGCIVDKLTYAIGKHVANRCRTSLASVTLFARRCAA
jgi:hypothetical protein